MFLNKLQKYKTKKEARDLESHVRPYIGQLLWHFFSKTRNWEPVLIYEVTPKILQAGINDKIIRIHFLLHGERSEVVIYNNHDFHSRFKIDDPR